ncbi:hypothetical protein RUND412_003228 [Rhizina undulata]
MKYTTSFILTALALAGSAVATTTPEAVEPAVESSWEYTPTKTYDPKKSKTEPEIPYKVYDKYYKEYYDKDKYYKDYDHDVKKFDKEEDSYKKVDYDSYYDSDSYKKESGSEILKSGCENCYGYDKGCEHEKCYGYSKDWKDIFEKGEEVKKYDKSGWKDYDRKQWEKENKYYKDDDESKDVYYKDLDYWKKYNEYYKKPVLPEKKGGKGSWGQWGWEGDLNFDEKEPVYDEKKHFYHDKKPVHHKKYEGEGEWQ